MSTENVIGDVEAFKRDSRERAAVLFYDAQERLRKLTEKREAVTWKDMMSVGMLMADALVLLEAGGVPTPRLPTVREMNR